MGEDKVKDPQLRNLMVLQETQYPQAFFFRSSEGFARRATVDYESWDRMFSRLMGIDGKVLDEEVPGTQQRNVEFFTRFKQQHPRQLVMLHYNGNARDPRYEAEPFFAGHWLYYEGQTLQVDLAVEAGVSEVAVERPEWFRTGIGRYVGSADDIGICEVDEVGRPNWHRAEQVQLISVDQERKTIRIRRGCYGTEPRSFKAGRAYLAVHVNEGPWGRKSNLMWHYNYSTCCPRDANGLTCGQVHARELAARFAPGGQLAAFDGLEFDVLQHSKQRYGPRRGLPGVDCNADGQADQGIFEGRDLYAVGMLAFLGDLRKRMGDQRLMLADGHSEHHQRGFGILNGIESEGWPTLSDHEMRDWSGGLNRHAFWTAFGREPVFNYINHKYVTHGDTPGEVRRPEFPAGINRLVFAAAVFTDTAVCYSLPPRPEPGETFGIWDELQMGRQQQIGWLGRPLGAAVHMATETPDLLAGVAKPPSADLLSRITGEDIQARIVGSCLHVYSTDPAADRLQFALRDMVLNGEDLAVAMTAAGDPLDGYPAAMARVGHVGYRTALSLLDSFSELTTGMQHRGEPEQPIDASTGAGVGSVAQLALGERSCAALRVHPPYRDGKTGLVYWERDVRIPDRGVLALATGMGERAPGRSDGVWFRIEARVVRDGAAGEPVELFGHSQIESRWMDHHVDLSPYAGSLLRLRFIADAGPQDNATTDHGYWGDVYVAVPGDDGRLPALASQQRMTWVGQGDFTSHFYFSSIAARRVDLTFDFEGNKPVRLRSLTAHAAADVMVRVFEHGLVVANPSPATVTLDLSRIAPGMRLRRLPGSSRQDPETNDGQPAGKLLELPAKDALFLVRNEP